MKKVIILTTIFLMAAIGAAAQSTAPNSPSKSMQTKTAKTTKTPKAAKTMPTGDAGIQTCISEKLGKSKMGSENFQVSVSGATATFTGATKVPGHKGGVSGIGKSCGAKSIVNNITIEGKPSVPKTPKTPKTKTNTEKTTSPKTS